MITSQGLSPISTPPPPIPTPLATYELHACRSKLRSLKLCSGQRDQQPLLRYNVQEELGRPRVMLTSREPTFMAEPGTVRGMLRLLSDNSEARICRTVGCCLN